jgi:uncharacterized SAM-binding protein YcdF (DUF218 family)
MLRWFTRVLAALGALLLIVTFTPLVWWWAESLDGPWDESRGGTLIVLGGDVVDDSLGQHSYWRCVYAARAWKQHRFERILLSGGSKTTGPMRQFLIGAGVPSEVIQMESRSTSTHENAEFTAQFLTGNKDPLTLMSSDFHMKRALGAFRKAGLQVRSEPIPDARKRYFTYLARWPVFLDLCGETVKLWGYRVRGWA